ncbi:pentapeptide repeat-containing protein [Streptomyces sp. BR123]|uniref:pentapeptide repeat-containing protein n=1 Tax=Streptomyces sp. BR123 TaxID=2749828 RepID=UPI0015C49F64|nr:pentapeptide repeat-containing protein [Streptomyces sp. BR123]NXY96854.1 pentapeptide repeat-containing protein [Streptomyces sp. BR123]
MLPADPEATRQVQEWLAEEGYSLYGIEHDFRGADLAGGDFSGSWFTQADLAGVRLAGASFYRADLQSADLTGADLTGADLVRANLDEAVLRSARLDGAKMSRASLCDVDASGASFRGTNILGASLLDTDMRGADLTDAVLYENFFEIKVDDSTVVRGLTGTVFGPITVFSGESSRELAGAELESWINARGGQIEVVPPRRPPR